MEVHHHPKVEKKSFKEYFLEFLMIFLAVTLGFFAENLREHLKENSEIRYDIKSLVKDLQSDVAMYHSTIAINQLSNRRTDTLITLLKKNRTNTSEIYYLARFITAANTVYRPGDKTYEQMKANGALKLITSHALLDSISNYCESLSYLPLQNALQNEKISDVHTVNYELFDGYVFQQMFLSGNVFYKSAENSVSKLDRNPPLLSNDPIIINRIILAYHYLSATTEFNSSFANSSCQQAVRLINLIKKEYNLENE